MIRSIIREAWADSPSKVIATLIVTPLAVLAGWAWIVIVAELLRSVGVRP